MNILMVSDVYFPRIYREVIAGRLAAAA